MHFNAELCWTSCVSCCGMFLALSLLAWTLHCWGDQKPGKVGPLPCCDVFFWIFSVVFFMWIFFLEHNKCTWTFNHNLTMMLSTKSNRQVKTKSKVKTTHFAKTKIRLESNLKSNSTQRVLPSTDSHQVMGVALNGKDDLRMLRGAVIIGLMGAAVLFMAPQMYRSDR